MSMGQSMGFLMLRSGTLSWQRQILYLWTQGHNSDSFCPFRDSPGKREGSKVAGRESRSIWLLLSTTIWLLLSIHCILVIIHKWKKYHSVCSDRSVPSCCTCTPRHYASCLHVFKKLSLAKMDWSARARTHTQNFQYFLPPMGVYAVPQKKKIFVRITHILENLS